METLNNNPAETAPVAPLAHAGSVPETGTPKASPSTGGLGAGQSAPATHSGTVSNISEAPAHPTPAVTVAPTAAPAPAAAPVVKGEMPKTTGKTPGGWNRFAGYNPHEAKNKKNDRGGSSKGRR